MRRQAKTALTIIAMLCTAASTRPNWDKVSWQMNIDQAERAYPALTYKDGDWFGWLPSRKIGHSAPLARFIEQGTKVRFRFDFENNWRITEISFIVPMGFDKAEAALEARFGLPVSGSRNEAHCLDDKGNRLVEDPSGVGHIIASCVAHATFIDRKNGNAYRIDTDYEYEMANFGSHSQFGKAQTVSIWPLADCNECKPQS